MIANLGRSVTQRVDLKSTALDLRHNFRFASQIPHHLNTLISNDKGNQLIVDGGVLNQRAISTERLLNRSDRKQILVLSCCLLASAAMLKMTRDFQQLSFAHQQLGLRVLCKFPESELRL